jgi:catechol O-methyltransferase
LTNKPQNLLSKINTYSTETNPLMNVGPAKGAFIENLIKAQRPPLMIELGGYIGYSAIQFGAAMRAHGGKYISLEMNPEMAAVANQLISLAGLSETVSVIVGAASESLSRLVESKEIGGVVPMVFLDHWQNAYLSDLKLMERLGVVGVGSVVIADNVIFPGAPDYLEWVKATCDGKRALQRDIGEGEKEKGDAGLVYETEVTEFDFQFGKDGVAVTKVVEKKNI